MSAADYRFAIDPVRLGLPTREELVEMRIWDLHYHGQGNYEAVVKYVERMGIECVFSLDVISLRGRTAAEVEAEAHEDLAL